MKKQALAIAIASALVATPSFAAQDTSGMHFTSASEGFYASIRARFVTSNNDNNGSDVQDASSRIGIRGNNDLGGGLEGFYQWELGVPINNGGDTSVRMGHVGLRGAFGSFWVGSNWSADYNWTHSSTDIANTHSGFFNYTNNRPGRTSNAIEYTTPDLNGFQGAVRLNVANSGDGTADNKDENDIDAWNIAANYAVQGFSVAGAYNVRPDGLKTHTEDSAGQNIGILHSAANDDPAPVNGIDGGQGSAASSRPHHQNSQAARALGKDDANSWTFKLGYAQDNWYVNGWYGEDNTSDEKYVRVRSMADDRTNGQAGDLRRVTEEAYTAVKAEDTTFFAVGGGVAVDKVNLYALYEQRENQTKQEDSYGTIGAQYNLGSQSRVWIEYTSNDYDSSPTTDDYVNIGMRHDF